MGLYGEASVAPERTRSKPIEEGYPVYGIQDLLAEGEVALGQGDYDKAFEVTVPDLHKPFLDQPEVEVVLKSVKEKNSHLEKAT